LVTTRRPMAVIQSYWTRKVAGISFNEDLPDENRGILVFARGRKDYR
jgi:hypothetical protein